MGNRQWYEVLPHRDDNGNFWSLRNEGAEGDRPRPVPLAPHKDPFASYKDFRDQLSSSFAMQLGLMGLGCVSTALSTKILVYEAAYFNDETLDHPLGTIIYGTRWGASVRVLVRVSQMGAKLSLNLRAVAAAAELGLVNASYEIIGYGIKSPRLLALAPTPGRFDTKTLTAIENVAKAFRERYANAQHRDELEAVPLQVQMYARPDTTPLDSARHTIFAMRQIASRNPLKEALKAAATAGIAKDLVQEIYKKHADVDGDADRPSLDDRRAAETWLKV